jgi:hypothetical protein
MKMEQPELVDFTVPAVDGDTRDKELVRESGPRLREVEALVVLNHEAS